MIILYLITILIIIITNKSNSSNSINKSKDFQIIGTYKFSGRFYSNLFVP